MMEWSSLFHKNKITLFSGGDFLPFFFASTFPNVLQKGFGSFLPHMYMAFSLFFQEHNLIGHRSLVHIV